VLQWFQKAELLNQKTQGAAKHVRREDGMPMNLPNWLTIGTSSAWADMFRPSLGA